MKFSPVIEISSGHIQGLTVNNCYQFKGIPYGEPTGGKNRFLPPVAKHPWAGVKRATEFGNSAPQGILKMDGANTGVKAHDPEVQRVSQELLALAGLSTIPVQFDEDCLYLNVYTPGIDTNKRPVMVWLHGGGFAVGSGTSEAFDGTYLCNQEDVVVVTLNHRLGAAGYLAIGELGQEFADSGNSGMLDIVLALQWVQQNIAMFGGNPGNVTIFGQSGGGRKVSILMGLPKARGLFHKAIVQSGSAERIIPLGEAIKAGRLVARKLGITKENISEIQKLSLKRILESVSEIEYPVYNFTSVIAPSIDGRNILSNPFYPEAHADSAKIPLLIGTNSNEMTAFLIGNPDWLNYTEDQARKHAARVIKIGDEAYTFYKKLLRETSPANILEAVLTDFTYWYGSVFTAESKAKQQGAPVFMYRMDYQSTALSNNLKSTHGIEIPFIFGNADFGSELLTKDYERGKLTRIMSKAWANFAKTGNPSSETLIWPAYTPTERQTIIFDENIKVIACPNEQRREFWEKRYFDI